MDFKDNYIVVTGGASGIGRATVEWLARRGARVLIGDVDQKNGAAAANELSGEGHSVAFHPLDLVQSASVTDFAAAAGVVAPVLGLVNAAGWDKLEPFMENSPEMWERLIAINLLGPMRLTRALLPGMIAAKRGKIVNISSDAGRSRQHGRDGLFRHQGRDHRLHQVSRARNGAL